MSAPYYEDDRVTILAGDCLDVLATLPDASVDAVVTDPPYGLEFMGKEWDSFGAQRSPSTAARAGDAAMTGGAGITATGYTDGGKRLSRPAFGGARPKTWRCDECGKRDQFRNDHGHNGWTQEVIDPTAPAPSAAFGDWCELWTAECLRVLKPGGHLLAFGGTRTWHRLACAVEDAGFEVRDSIAWMYGSGFPKSLDVSKAIDKAAGAEREVTGTRPVVVDQWTAKGREAYARGESVAAVDITAPATDAARTWQGWGTALKPAFEPVVVARKPLVGTVAGNVLAHGTGALNVDACRVGDDPITQHGRKSQEGSSYVLSTEESGRSWSGRWPANVVLDESQAAELDQQSGESVSPPVGSTCAPKPHKSGSMGGGIKQNAVPMENGYGDQGGASRFFYVAKADAGERVRVNGTAHPTVKPLALMRWLVRLVTPPGGTVLEPFAGSGTTVEACILEGFRCIAIEREADYLPLIMQRINRRVDPVAAVLAAGDDAGLFDLLGEETA